jgi:hypothetical protein
MLVGAVQEIYRQLALPGAFPEVQVLGYVVLIDAYVSQMVHHSRLRWTRPHLYFRSSEPQPPSAARLRKPLSESGGSLATGRVSRRSGIGPE